MSLNGGIADIGDLERGEGAYISDYMDCCWISGMKGRDFRNMLELSGMTLNTRVNLHNTVISGQVNDRNASLMMKGLLAVACSCRPDSTSVRYHVKSENLHNVLRDGSDVRAVIDSLMCPGYRYSGIKTSGKLSKALPEKSEALFGELFSKVNDGIFVIVGDRDESLVRKELREYMGLFATNKRIPVRPSVSYQPISGAMTHIDEGDRNAVYMAMSVPMPLTIDNYAVSEVAGMMLKKELSSALVGSGMYAKVYYDTKIAPHERFNVMIVLEEVPGVVAPAAEEVARKIIHGAFKNERLSEMTGAQMDACKAWLKHNNAIRTKSPDYWVNAILLRYLEGKDFTTGYDNKIDEVSAEEVKALLSSLYEAGKVEYIIRKK
jgi:hypothetical protein